MNIRKLIPILLVAFVLILFLSIYTIHSDYSRNRYWTTLRNANDDQKIEHLISQSEQTVIDSKGNKYYFFPECKYSDFHVGLFYSNATSHNVNYPLPDSLPFLPSFGRYTEVYFYHLFENWFIFQETVSLPHEFFPVSTQIKLNTATVNNEENMDR